MVKKIIENKLYTPTQSAKAREYYNKGTDYLNDKKFTLAVENLRLAIAEDPNYIDAYDNLGLTFRQIKELDSAEFYYLLSHKKFPKGSVALRNLAVVEEYRHNYNRGVEYYKQAIKIDDKDAESYYGLTRMYFMLQEYTKALEYGSITEKYYKEDNNPYLGDCYSMECMIYIMMDKKDKAKEYMELAKKAGAQIPDQVAEMLK